MRRGLRIVGRCILFLLAILLVVCTAGEIRERILVHRAAALLSDIHSLHLHQSNWNDAQRLMTRWGRWGHYDGACTFDDCMYVITLHDLTAPTNNNVAEWPSRVTVFLSAFRLLPRQWGGGLREMQAMFFVQKGVVVRSGFSIDMTVSPFAKNRQSVCCGYELIMSVRNQASLGLPSWIRDEEERSRHPDYTTWRPGGCTFCLMGRVTYADSMPSEEAAKLSDFQLSCATRWSSCLTLEELDPAAHAWHLYTSPWGDPENTATQATPVGCTLPIYSLGRDANRIVSVEALEDGVSTGRDDAGVEYERSSIRVLTALKGDAPWAVGSTQDVLSSGSPFGEEMRKPTHLLQGRHYFLMLDKDDGKMRKSLSFESCGIVEEYPTGDQEVMLGVAMDHRLNGFEPSVSLEGFARHAPKPWDH